jgi:hypothetical protein
MDYDKIQCMVGDEMCVIDMDVFQTAHEELADKYRALGLSGRTLDLAIVANLPRRLAEMLGGRAGHGIDQVLQHRLRPLLPNPELASVAPKSAATGPPSMHRPRMRAASNLR